MRKFLVLALFVLACVSVGWALNEYARSGETLAEFPLETRSGAVATVSLDPSMSPVRAFLTVAYTLHLEDVSNDAYAYDVVIKDPAGSLVVSEKKTLIRDQNDQGITTERSTSHHIIGTFDVAARGLYSLEWTVQQKKAAVESLSVEFRRNVAGMNIPLLIFGGGCFALGGIVLLSGRRRRK